MVLGVGGRAVSQPLHVWRAVEVGAADGQALDPGTSGKAHRTGWVVAKTKRPPGRRTRHASDITRAESATKGTTPYAVNTVSKEESANGSTLPSHWAIASAMPCRRSISLTHLEHPAGQVGRDDLDLALRPQPAGALAGTTTDLQDAAGRPGGAPNRSSSARSILLPIRSPRRRGRPVVSVIVLRLQIPPPPLAATVSA